MKTNKINLLDCTLRDGGYHNNWNFSKEVYQNYISTINNSGISYVEVGFRFDEKNNFLGPFAYSPDYFVKNLEFKKKINLALMINCSDLIKKKFTKKYIDKVIHNKNKSPFKIIRFAAHFDEVPLALEKIKYIKKKGYKVFLNLMQASTKLEKDFIKIFKIIKISKLFDVLYFADSLGAMKPEEIKKVCGYFRKYWNKEFGIHAHNNCGLALKNSIQAIACGATWVDGTMLGMGRGAGNAKTEELVKKNYFKKNISHKIIKKCCNKSFLDLKKKYEWGPSKAYAYAALNNIHPTYVQVLQNEISNKSNNIIDILSKIKKTNLISYNPLMIRKYFQSFIKKNKGGSWNAKNWCKNKNLLIVGKGEYIKKYKDELIYFIKKNKPIVVSLNFNKDISKKYIDYFIVSNPEKIILDFEKIFTTKKKIIIPKSRFKKIYSNKKYKKNFLDYELILSNNKFKINSNYCEIPSNLVLFYCLSLAKIGNPKKIYLAGFDGYGTDDYREIEINQNFSYFNEIFGDKILSITPTSYKVKKSSLYAYI